MRALKHRKGEQKERERERERDESDSLLSLPWLALSEEWRNERRRNLHSFFPKKKTSVPYSSFIISRRLLFKMAASLSYRSGGSVGSTAARSAGRGAAVRAPIAAAARPASSSSTSAAVVAAAALLRRSSNGALPPPPGALLLLACVSPLFRRGDERAVEDLLGGKLGV